MTGATVLEPESVIVLRSAAEALRVNVIALRYIKKTAMFIPQIDDINFAIRMTGCPFDS